MNQAVFFVRERTHYCNSTEPSYRPTRMTESHGSSTLTGRVEYIRVCNGHGFRAIADFVADGKPNFGDAEPDQPWFHFEPSPAELEFAENLLFQHSCQNSGSTKNNKPNMTPGFDRTTCLCET
jgi:hypothetical protein